MSENSNENTDLIDPDMVESVVKDIASNSQVKQIDETILRWLLGSDMKAAALASGYSQSYAESGVQKRIKAALQGKDFVEGGSKRSKIWRERLEIICGTLPDRYRQLCQLRLPTIAKIEGKALEMMEDDPKLAIEKPTLLRQVKQAAGALTDESPAPRGLNISHLTLIQNALRLNLEASLEPKPVGGKAIEHE
jgi:hypothetical protein